MKLLPFIRFINGDGIAPKFLFALGITGAIVLFYYDISIPGEADFYKGSTRMVPALLLTFAAGYFLTKRASLQVEALSDMERKSLFGYKKFCIGYWLRFELFILLLFPSYLSIEGVLRIASQEFKDDFYIMHYRHSYEKFCPKNGSCKLLSKQYLELDSRYQMEGKLPVGTDLANRPEEDLAACKRDAEIFFETGYGTFFCPLPDEPKIIEFTLDDGVPVRQDIRGYGVIASGWKSPFRMSFKRAYFLDAFDNRTELIEVDG